MQNTKTWESHVGTQKSDIELDNSFNIRSHFASGFKLWPLDLIGFISICMLIRVFGVKRDII